MQRTHATKNKVTSVILLRKNMVSKNIEEKVEDYIRLFGPMTVYLEGAVPEEKN